MNTADTSTLAGELRGVISTLTRRLREQAHAEDLTGSQKSVLIRLEQGGSATVTALACAEGVRPQSMSATVAALEAAGLVSRTPDPNDGRQTLLFLTPACRDWIAASRAARKDWLLQAIHAKLDAAEQEELRKAVGLLKRLAEL